MNPWFLIGLALGAIAGCTAGRVLEHQEREREGRQAWLRARRIPGVHITQEVQSGGWLH